MMPRQSYNSPRRQQQAADTRRVIREAALALFLSQGYGATTIDQIAQRAGVAKPTVYATFRSKAGLLHHLLDVLVAGDEASPAVAQSDEWQHALAAGDTQQIFDELAAMSRTICDRAADVLAIVAGGASTDAELAQAHELGLQFRLADMQLVADALAVRGLLADGIDRDEAAETLWALGDPMLFTNLVRQRGWSSERYQSWLARAWRRVLTAE